MDDRVRIYELAKRMNMSNQDVIQALRALGYDVKSHSSTIDSSAINLLIASFKKKKEKSTKPKEIKELTPVKTTIAPKSEKIVKPQPVETVVKPPAVKPRVLSRYRKPDATAPAIPVDPAAIQPLHAEENPRRLSAHSKSSFLLPLIKF